MKQNVKTQTALIDKSDAPSGYTPVPKDSIRTPFGSNKNICEDCDWRSDCDGRKFSCMSYKRKDGIGVVFKKGENNGFEK